MKILDLVSLKPLILLLRQAIAHRKKTNLPEFLCDQDFA